jgi:hypothetical protein
MGQAETGTSDEPAPRLTIGQRILTSLPNLDRKKSRSIEGGSGNAIQPDEVISPGGDGKGPAQRPSRSRDAFVKAPQTGKNAPKADPTANMSNDELINMVKRVDDRERFYALFAGPLGAAIAIILTVKNYHLNPAVGHKGHVNPDYILLEGFVSVVLGGIVVLAALWRRRSFVGYTLFFFGVTVLPYGILFCGLGGWMIWRTLRYQKALTARGVTPRGGGTRASRPSTQSPRAAARAGSTDARERTRMRRAEAHERRRTKKSPEPTGPPPSKRYTPPKPTRPRPSAPA